MLLFLSTKWRSLTHRWLAVLLVSLFAVVGLTASVFAVQGSIIGAIEIDGPANGGAPGADHFDHLGTPVNTGAALDWVKDSLANTDPPSVVDSIATGIQPGVTGRVGGTGHWHGVRIMDTFAGNEQDQFLTGGKENDLSTWNIGPGSIGSSKYDATQAYLANNQVDLFFGMERRGNNGTTAYDFEFNQQAPDPNSEFPGYIPNRTEGDILFTFEMQGSGSSGSAVGYVFRYNEAQEMYLLVAPAPAGVVASINNSTNTPAPPWGHVSGQGNWVGGNLERFEFGEAKAPLSLLPGVNSCGGTAYVQLRTRSSSTENSDLKDTTKIFQFEFGGPSAVADVSTDCPAPADTQPHFNYSAVGSLNSSGGTSNLTYSWVFTPTNGATIVGGNSSTDLSGSRFINMNGAASTTISAEVTVTEGSGQGACFVRQVAAPVVVYALISGTPTLSAGCDLVITYNASNITGGNPPLTYSWQFQRFDGANFVNVGNPVSGVSGTFTAPQDGLYRAVLTVTDSSGCTYLVNTGQVSAAPALTASAAKTSEDGVNMTVTLTANVNDATASKQWQRWNGTNWVNISGQTGTTLIYSSFEADGTASSSGTFTIGSDTYIGQVYTVQLRVEATSIRNDQPCVVNSNAVTVKKVIAVDP